MNNNTFKRHPVITIVIFIVTVVLMLDFLSAHLYTLIQGYPFYMKGQKNRPKIERIYRVPSAIYHHDLAKNKTVDYGTINNYRHIIYTNSLGFKDKSCRKVPLVSDKYRVLFIGDSFVDAPGFNYEDTFVGLIGMELAKEGIEEFNAGVASYSPIIYWRKIKYLLEDVGLKFNEVVVFIDISDIEDEACYYCLDGNGNVAGQDIGFRLYDERVNNFGNPETLIKNNTIFMYSALYRLDVLLNKNINIKRSSWTVNKDIYLEYADKGLKMAGIRMDNLYELLNKRGIKLTVAVYPWPDQIISGDLDSIQVSYWKDWCKRHAVPLVNYFPYFITGRTKKELQAAINKYYLVYDVHWNKNGQRLVADVFLDFYKKQKDERD